MRGRLLLLLLLSRCILRSRLRLRLLRLFKRELLSHYDDRGLDDRESIAGAAAKLEGRLDARYPDDWYWRCCIVRRMLVMFNIHRLYIDQGKFVHRLFLDAVEVLVSFGSVLCC